jgi:hypothetical protein
MQIHAIPCESMQKRKRVAYFPLFSRFKAKNDLHGFCMGFAYTFSTCKKHAKKFEQ